MSASCFGGFGGAQFIVFWYSVLCIVVFSFRRFSIVLWCCMFLSHKFRCQFREINLLVIYHECSYLNKCAYYFNLWLTLNTSERRHIYKENTKIPKKKLWSFYLLMCWPKEKICSNIYLLKRLNLHVHRFIKTKRFNQSSPILMFKILIKINIYWFFLSYSLYIYIDHTFTYRYSVNIFFCLCIKTNRHGLNTFGI